MTRPHPDKDDPSRQARETSDAVLAGAMIALLGPLDAQTASHAATEALFAAEFGVPASWSGPRVNAFQHCLWLCLMGKRIGHEQAARVGAAYEVMRGAPTAFAAHAHGMELNEIEQDTWVDVMNNGEGLVCAKKKTSCADCCKNTGWWVWKGRGLVRNEPARPATTGGTDKPEKPPEAPPTRSGPKGPEKPKEPEPEEPKEPEEKDEQRRPAGDDVAVTTTTQASGDAQRSSLPWKLIPTDAFKDEGPPPWPDPCEQAPMWCVGSSGGGGGPPGTPEPVCEDPFDWSCPFKTY